MLEKMKYYKTRLCESRIIGLVAVTILMSAVITFLTFSLNTVTINDGVSVQKVYTLKTQTTDLVKLAKLSSDNFIVTDMNKSGNKINISLRYSIPVYVTSGENTTTVQLAKGSTVADAVNEAGYVLDEHDTVNFPLDTVINDTVYIDVIDVNYVTESYTTSIPYNTKTVYSKKCSNKTVTTKGENGTMNVTSLTKFVNGVATETTTLSEDVISEAVDEVVTVGITSAASSYKSSVTTSADIKSISTLAPSKPIELDENGNPVNYSKHITVQATGYTYTGNNCASGMAPQPGCVAVNTNLYPFGTKFYIKSSDGRYIYGYAVAADTGSFLKSRPTNFDLFFATKSECISFGRRNIEVYVLN